jgi:uncharacterized protein YjiK
VRALGALAWIVFWIPSSASGQARSVLATFHVGQVEPAQHELVPELREASGLALTSDGRLFVHNDEQAIIHQVDPSTGGTIKAFRVGTLGVAGDFEGLAIVDERFFLVTSAGDLLVFAEGAPNARVGFEAFPTGLEARCEVEGLAYDAPTRSLLLPCKTTRGPYLARHLAVFAVSIETMTPEEAPRYLIPEEAIDEAGGRDAFRPSGIEVHPVTGSLLIVSAEDRTVVELSREGAILSVARLRARLHPQTEGLTFGLDGAMILADEGAGGRGRLSIYPVRPLD